MAISKRRHSSGAPPHAKCRFKLSTVAIAASDPRRPHPYLSPKPERSCLRKDHPVVTPRHTPHAAARRRNLVSAVALLTALVLGACSTGSGSSRSEGDASASGGSGSGLHVVVSDPPLTDLVRRVAGDGVDVVGLVPLGADGHTYEPRPEDARKLAKANVYIENGLGLNNAVSGF